MRGVHLASFNHSVGSFSHSAWRDCNLNRQNRLIPAEKTSPRVWMASMKSYGGFVTQSGLKYPEHKFTTIFIQRSFLLSSWRLIRKFGLCREPCCVEHKPSCQQGVCKSPFSTFHLKMQIWSSCQDAWKRDIACVLSTYHRHNLSFVTKEMQPFSVRETRRCFPLFSTRC